MVWYPLSPNVYIPIIIEFPAITSLLRCWAAAGGTKHLITVRCAVSRNHHQPLSPPPAGLSPPQSPHLTIPPPQPDFIPPPTCIPAVVAQSEPGEGEGGERGSAGHAGEARPPVRHRARGDRQGPQEPEHSSGKLSVSQLFRCDSL